MARREQRKPVIGLVGGIGSGKSTIARQFEVLGCAVIDADALANEALDWPGVRRKLVTWWGSGVMGKDGRVDRAAMAKVVFGDEGELRRLEGVVHPLVHRERRRLRAKYEADRRVKAIVEDVPLLVEKGLVGECDAVVFVGASRVQRVRRVREGRGWSERELRRREKLQAGLDKKRGTADYVIDNSADEADSLSQTRRVLSQILEQYRTAAHPRKDGRSKSGRDRRNP